jgi:hypothetical protein
MLQQRKHAIEGVGLQKQQMLSSRTFKRINNSTCSAIMARKTSSQHMFATVQGQVSCKTHAVAPLAPA